MTAEKTAFVFGASGLVGRSLVKELISNPEYIQIFLMVRKPMAIVNQKVQEVLLDNFEAVDFSNLDSKNTHIFCCVGTTIKAAGSQEAFRLVDYDLPLKFGSWAKQRGFDTFVVVSSIGAKAGSGNFYLKTKGEMEDSLRDLQLSRLIIVRPSLLLGTRSEFRLGEELAKVFSGVMKLLFFGPLTKYRAIKALTVARAMMILANSDHKTGIFESDKLQEIGS